MINNMTYWNLTTEKKLNLLTYALFYYRYWSLTWSKFKGQDHYFFTMTLLSAFLIVYKPLISQFNS